ncbi:MAG: 23S rRNA (guanosine(2251)-2'-O)-methyltransferase RlmB [Oligoflexus sp.]
MNPKQSRDSSSGARRSRRPGRSATSEAVDDRALWLNSWSALQEYLRASPSSLLRIEVQPASETKIKILLENHQVNIRPSVRTDLPTAFRAEIKVVEWSESDMLDDLTENRASSLVLALDQITDTRNLGAIARSAAFFGVPWLIMPKDRQANITGGTISAAQGAFAFVKPVFVTNLSRTLTQLKEQGFWVLGTDMNGESVSTVTGLYDRTVLVLGSEDRGMRTLTRRNCDRMIAIDSHSQGVESLNVAVAAGIFLHQLRPIQNTQ